MASQSRKGFFNWMFNPAPTGESVSEVTIGDRFQHQHSRASVWVVERISKVGASTYPLVSLSREGRPDLKKVVSIAVLQDGEDFKPAA